MLVDDAFVSCSDPDTYVQRLRGAGDAARIPVLGPLLPVHEVVADLTEPQPQRLAPDPSRAVLVAPRSSAVAPIAAALAAAVDAAFVPVADADELAAVPARFADARWLTLVGLADEIGDHTVARLHDAVWAAVGDAGFRGHLSVLSAPDARLVAWLVAKGLAFPRRRLPAVEDLRVWPAFDSLPARYGRGRWVTRDRATVAELVPILLGTHVGVTSFIAHGRDDVIHLHDTVICAAAPDPVATRGDVRPNLPVCAFTGRCFRSEIPPEQIVPARSLLTDVAFTNACMGSRTADGLFPAEYLLPAGFAAGPAAAYVGTATLVNGLASLNDVFHMLCGAGAAVAEAVSAINDHLRYAHNDLPYFTPLGLPWLRTGAGPDAAPAAVDPLLEVAGGRVSVQDGERAGKVGSALAGLARRAGADRRPRHVVLSSARSAPALSVFEQAPPLGPDELGRLRRRIRGLGDAIVALEQVPMLGFRYSRQGNIQVTLRDQVNALAQTMQTAVAFGDVARLDKRLASLASGVRRAERGLADALWQRGTTSFVNFDDLWGEVLEQRPPEPVGEPCPYCGRAVVRLDAQHPLFPGLARTGLVCARCCMTFDRDLRSPVTAAELDCPNVWRRGEEVGITLRLTVAAPDPAPVEATVGIHTEACDRNGVGFPRPVEVALVPGREHEVTVTADVHADAHMHQEYLRAFVVARGTITIATRPIYVRPADFALPLVGAG